MNRYPKIGELVEVQVNSLPTELQDLGDVIGEVYHRDGEYIYVRMCMTGIEVERYSCELKEYVPVSQPDNGMPSKLCNVGSNPAGDAKLKNSKEIS